MRAAVFITLSGCSFQQPFNDPRLDSMKMAAQETRLMLEDYYGDHQVMQETWYNDASRNNQFLADKIARAIVWEDRFIIGALGSSVTAGNGNCRYDNYTSQLHRLLSPLFAAGNVSVEIRNTAQGGECGDSHRNQVWCINSLAGSDLDVLHYSWTYFEASDRNREQTHELFYRWSLMQSGSPVPQILYTNDCEHVSDKDSSLLENYERYGANFLCMTRGIKKAGYKGKVWGEVGDTIHDTTRYGEAADVYADRRESLGVVFRNWHPGPLLFQTTADAMVYAYTDAMLLAIDQIGKTADPKKRWPFDRMSIDPKTLPPVEACNEDWCNGSTPPACLTFSTPVFGSSNIRWLEDESPGWQRWDGKVRVSYPEIKKQLPQCQYNHHCGGLIFREPEKQLVFQLPEFEKGIIALCCLGKKCGDKLKAANLEYKLNNNPIPDAPEVMMADKCLNIQRTHSPANIGQDRQVLSISVPAGVSMPPITHIMVL